MPFCYRYFVAFISPVYCKRLVASAYIPFFVEVIPEFYAYDADLVSPEL